MKCALVSIMLRYRSWGIKSGKVVLQPVSSVKKLVFTVVTSAIILLKTII